MNKLLKGESIDHFGLRNARSEIDAPIAVLDEFTNLRSFYIKPDGTKLYAVNQLDDTIYQYSLSTAWNIGTLSYDSKSYAVTAEESEPRGVWFKSDGTKMYVVGFGSDTFYQYSLSTAWDVSTASYDSVSLAAQDIAPQAIVFTPDGTGFYEVGYSNKTAYQYTLSTAWDLSTASYASKSFGVGTEVTGFFYGLAFSSDGTKMYANDSSNGIFQYSLSTAWDVSTASYDSKTYDHGLAAFGIFMRPNDEQIIVGSISTILFSLNLLTAKDIESAKFVAKNAYFCDFLEGKQITELVMAFNGEHFYVGQRIDGYVYQVDLSEPTNVASGTYNNKFLDVSSQVVDIRAMDLSNDGTKLFVADAITNVVYQYTLGTAWDISTGSYDSKSYDSSTVVESANSLRISTDGTKMYIGSSGGQGRILYQYNLSTAFDVSTASYSSNYLDVSTYQGGNLPGFAFSNDGKKLLFGAMHLSGFTLFNETHEWVLSTAWDISTASFSGNTFDEAPVVIPSNSGSQSFDVSPNGDKMYINKTAPYIIYQINL